MFEQKMFIFEPIFKILVVILGLCNKMAVADILSGDSEFIELQKGGF